MTKQINKYFIVTIVIINILFFTHNITQAAEVDDFVITVKTDNTGSSSDTQFTIPASGGGYDYNVDCDNDGTDETTGQTGDYTCAAHSHFRVISKNRI